MAFVLSGCKPPPVNVPAVPRYEEGVPTSSGYDDLALRTSEMSSPGEVPSDPQEAYDAALAELERRGVRIIPKAPDGGAGDLIDDWSTFTTAFPTVILVTVRWDEYTVRRKAEILWHEIVHLRQYEEFGPIKMGLLYAVPEGRWAIEVQAYRESYRMRRQFGDSEETLRKHMNPRAEGLYRRYLLDSMPREYAINRAIEIWMLDSPEP